MNTPIRVDVKFKNISCLRLSSIQFKDGVYSTSDETEIEILRIKNYSLFE